MAKGEQNAPGISQTADNPAPNHAAPPPNVCSPDPLQGFKPEAEGHVQHVRKPSAYVHNKHEGWGVSSTHLNDPTLPHGLQQTNNTPHHATTAILKDRMDDEHPTIEYAMMAAENVMRTNTVSISNAKKHK